MRYLFPMVSLFLPLWLGAYQTPDFTLSNQSIPENEDLYTFIGSFSPSDSLSTGLSYVLADSAQTSDNHLFRIRHDSLFSYYSYDYEVASSYSIRVVATEDSSGLAFAKNFTITIQNLTGKWDTDGYADAEVAAKYPQVNEGDYIIFTRTAYGQIYKANNEFANLDYPNKILIKGAYYTLLSLRLTHVVGPSTEQRIPITNFLGQVRTPIVRLYDGTNWRITGEYDPAAGTGSPYFTGCVKNGSGVDYSFSNGTYGIWANNEWQSESGLSCLSIDDTASHFEVDHIEISDGGFAGLLVKDDNGPRDMDSVYIHHLYIHDIGSEGIYLGSTQNGVQPMFHDLRIENCLIVRTGGEALQTEQLGEGCVIRNNVLWGAMDWLDPFMRYQDNTMQFSVRTGGLIVENNILLGAGEKFYNVSNKPLESLPVTDDSILVRNNLAWGCRGPMGVFQFKSTNAFTNWHWTGNTFGNFTYNYDIVYPNHYITNDQVFNVATDSVEIDIVNNTFDTTKSYIGGADYNSTGIFTIEDNVHDSAMVAPEFRNDLGSYGQVGYLRWMRWTDTIGVSSYRFPYYKTNKGDAMFFDPGDVVQYWNANGETRFYECQQYHTSVRPDTASSSYWQELTWVNGADTFHIPPDDFRLDELSPYQQDSLGLQDTLATIQASSWAPAQRIAERTKPEVATEPEATEPSVPRSNPRLRRNSREIIMTVFPNPASDQMQVRLDMPESQEATIWIVNQFGQQVQGLHAGILLPKGITILPVNTSTLPTGTYQIVVQTDAGITAHAFIRGY